MTEARIGHGTLLQRGDSAAPPNYTTVAEVMDITPPQAEADDIEATHMESPGRRKEYIQGLIDGGEATFQLNWIPDNPTHDHITGLKALQRSGETVPWRLRLPDDVLIWNFPAYVKSFNPEIPVGDKMTASVTLKVTGDETFGL